jgi:hypothetical protein
MADSSTIIPQNRPIVAPLPGSNAPPAATAAPLPVDPNNPALAQADTAANTAYGQETATAQKLNKFLASFPPASNPSAVPGVDANGYALGNQMASGAGLPPFTAAQLTQAQQKSASDPRTKQLNQLLSKAATDPSSIKKNLPAAVALANQISSSTGTNVWALVTLALMGAAKDNQADQQYHIKILEMLNSMQTQMMKTSDTLAKTQKDLDKAVGSGKDANTNAQVNFPVDMSYSNFSSLDKNGKIIATNLSAPASSASQVDPKSLNSTGKTMNVGKAFSWDYKFTNPNDSNSTIIGNGHTLAEAQQDAANQINQAAQSKEGSTRQIGSTGLTQALQQFSQQLDQLNQKISQEQNKVQNGVQNEQQCYAMITSVLKVIYDGASTITRNLL